MHPLPHPQLTIATTSTAVKLLSTPLKLTIGITHDPVTHRWKTFGLNSSPGEFPGGLTVRIQYFLCHGPGSIPSEGTVIPQATQHSQKEIHLAISFAPYTALLHK